MPQHLCGNDLKHPKTDTSPHLFGHMCSNMYKMWTKSFHGRIAILESKSSWRSVDTPLKNQHFSFFSPIVHGKFWKKCKNAKTVHCPMLPVVGYRSPLWPRYHTIWFKTYILKDNCPFKLLLGKKGKKKNFTISCYTYIHKTNTC